MADTWVYVLFEGIYSAKRVLGVYSILEKAKAAAEESAKALEMSAEINGWENLGVDKWEAAISRWESTTADPSWTWTHTIEEYVIDEEAERA